MNKIELIKKITAILAKDLAGLKSAALGTYAAATGEESKPENKYDTFALEASYLAGAQAKRVLDIESSLAVYKTLEVRNFTSQSRIESTALVEVDLDGKTTFVFIVPAKGSLTLTHEGISIQVITPQSPLGEALLGSKVGDFVKLDRGSRELEYEIVSIR